MCQGPSPACRSGRGLQPRLPQGPVPSPSPMLRTHRTHQSKNLVFGEQVCNKSRAHPTPLLITA